MQKNQNIEELYIRIFKISILSIMTIGLISIVVFLTYSAYLYSQTPNQPRPAEKAIFKDVNLQDFQNELNREISEKKLSTNTKVVNNVNALSTLKYNEEALQMYRCSIEFANSVNAVSEETESKKIAEQVELLRYQIEKASDHYLRGDAWVNSAKNFICNALKDTNIIALRKEGKIDQIFLPTLNFHIKTWDYNQTQKISFDTKEEDRVRTENMIEASRIANDKTFGLNLLIAAGCSFGIFIFFALYLIFYRLERNLKNINSSLTTINKRYET
jgi:hypothetical protein